MGPVDGTWPWLRFAYRRADSPNFNWSRQFFIAVHQVASATRPDASDPRVRGQFARRERFFYTTESPDEPVYVAAPPAEIPDLVDGVCERMRTWRGHPLAAAGWVLGAVLAIQPFQDVNDSVARSVSNTVLYRASYREPLLPDCNKRDYMKYFKTLDCLGDRFSCTVDVTPFINWLGWEQIHRALDWLDLLEWEYPSRFEELCALRAPSGEGLLDRANRLVERLAGAEVAEASV